nr:MAG TPA: hypothetical protein [Caudoviricetes sp.]
MSGKGERKRLKSFTYYHYFIILLLNINILSRPHFTFDNNFKVFSYYF